MNVYPKQKETHRYKKQTCGYQKGEGEIRGMDLQTTMYKIDKQEGYTV